MQLDDAASVLGETDFFQICTLEQRRMLGFAAEQRSVRAGDLLFRKGDVVEGAYVLIEGTLESRDGEHEPERSSELGTVFGELALLSRQPRRATVEAVTDAEVLFVPRHAFLKLVEQFPTLADALQDHISGRLHDFVDPINRNLGKLKR